MVSFENDKDNNEEAIRKAIDEEILSLDDYEYRDHIKRESERARFRSASIFELTSSTLISALLLYLSWSYITLDASEHQRAAALLKNQNTLFAFGILFVQSFSFILTGYTIAVGLIVALKDDFPGFLSTVISSAFSVSSGGLILSSATKELIKRRKSSKPTLNVRMSVESRLVADIDRSADTMRSARFRPNSLLFAGSFVSVLGILLFIATLPQPSAVGEEWTRRAVEITPRLVLFLFVQVLAGFFLRQYRTSLEDFRYYEAILRHREDRLASYLVRTEQKNHEAINAFADKLLEDREFLRITQGDTSFVIETHKLEKMNSRA